MQADDERAAKRRWENVCEFRDWLAQKGEEDGKTLIDLTQTVSLMNLLEGREEAEPNAVRLSTLHAAKGLEYDHVYLAGVEEEMLPHRECLEGPRLEEERRLMYVGITRARKSLVLTWCKRRKRGGEWTDCEQSRFITEMDGGALRHAGNAGENADKSTGRQRLAGLKAMLSGQ